MFSRDFSTLPNKMCQSQHETFPAHTDKLQLKRNNSLKQDQYLVEHEDLLTTQKMSLTQFSLIMVMTNLHFASFKKKVILLHIQLLTPFHSQLCHPS